MLLSRCLAEGRRGGVGWGGGGGLSEVVSC